MALEIYKPGQGKFARVSAYVLGFGLILFGGKTLYGYINVPNRAWVEGVPLIGEISIYNTIAFGAVLIVGLLWHLFLNRPTSADTLIDTEQEMKKVSWPSRREVRNATVVVVIVTFTMALLLFGFDRLLQWLFRLVY